jgi:hypothetical protein
MVNGTPTRVPITPHPTEETIDKIFTSGTQIISSIDMSTLTHTAQGIKPSFTAKKLIVKSGIVQTRDIISTISQAALLAMCTPVDETVTLVKESDETEERHSDKNNNDQLDELAKLAV